MPRIAAPRVVPSAAGLAALAIGTLVLGGCVKPVANTSTLPRSPAPTAPVSPAPVTPTAAVTRTPPATPTFAEATATSCGGYPSAEQVIALVRRTTGVLPANATAAVRQGPLCSGTWQYTVLVLPDHDPLQVITRGTPSALQLVTAGTDVCSEVAVRATAPAGIRAVANC